MLSLHTVCRELVRALNILFLCIVLQGIIGTGSGAWTSRLVTLGRDAVRCDGGVRYRKEVRDLSPSELSRFRSAMGALSNSRPKHFDYFPPPTVWDELVAAHLAHLDEAHGGSYFLPWHRLFVLAAENAVRDISGDTTFTMPYWDWAADAADPALSSVFSAPFLGAAPTLDGVFSQLSSIYPRPRPVQRGFNSSASGDVAAQNGVRFATTADMAATKGLATWEDFAKGVEDAHDIVHVGVGGTLNSFHYSPNDPLFYLIHAFADKLWLDRQLASRNASEFGGMHRLGGQFQPASPDFVLSLFEVAVRDALSPQCVRYVPYRGECDKLG